MNASESRLFLIRKFQYMRPHHRKKDFYTTSVLRDAKLCNLPDSFGMDGKNMLNEIELVMAALTPLSKKK